MDEGYKDCYVGTFAGTLLRHVTLPATLQVLGDGVFCGCASLRSVTFAEGSQLRKIGTGCFVGCGLEEFVAPPGLRTIGQGAFKQCRDLKRVVLNEGLEALEEYRYEYETRYSHYCNGIFQESGLEEIILPSTLMSIGHNVFGICPDFSVVWVKGSCTADIEDAVPYYVAIIPTKDKLIKNVPILDLRRQKEIVLSEGICEIGDYWFRGCEAESVTIPASVRNIGARSFCRCEELRHVQLTKGSRLETIGDYCFFCCGLGEITLPASLREIGPYAFWRCSLDTIYVETGCAVNVAKSLDDPVRVVSVPPH